MYNKSVSKIIDLFEHETGDKKKSLKKWRSCSKLQAKSYTTK